MSINMVDYAAIAAAHRRIKGKVRRTLCEQSYTLSNMLGCDIFIAFEDMQFTASFKERGALNKLLSLKKGEGQKGVIAASAGNHAKALAYHATRLGFAATVVMPRFTPNVKAFDAQRLGAKVILKGENFDEANRYALELAKTEQLEYIHPFNDEAIIAGQGTLAIEMLEDLPDLEVLIAPIGGGGLIAGMAIAAKTIKPAVKIVGVQAERYPAVKQILAGEPVSIGRSTLADGIAIKHPGKLTLDIIKDKVDDILLVSEKSIERAVSLYLNIEKRVAEGAGAAALAAIVQYPERFTGSRVGVVLSGANIDSKVLAYILMRDLAHEGRIVRIRIILGDRPGLLSKVSALVGDQDGNILDVEHERLFSQVHGTDTTIVMTIEVKNFEHADEICQNLIDAGHEAELLKTGKTGAGGV